MCAQGKTYTTPEEVIMNNDFDLQVVDLIVTHGGRAHRDEFITVCLAEAFLWVPVPVERRDPTPEELDDPKVLVLDVGGQHDPAKANFDHHQLPRDADPDCALSLFLKAWGSFEEYQNTLLWVEPTVILDSKGPSVLCKELDIAKESFVRMWSPIEASLLKLFEAGAVPLDLMRNIGAGIDRYVSKIQRELQCAVEGAGEAVTASRSGVQVPGMFMDGQFEPKTMEMFRKHLEERDQCALAFCISFDDRGSGYSLYRFDDNPQIDFGQLEGHPAVNFAHKAGFIAKTRDRMCDPVSLVEGAIVVATPEPAQA